MRKKETSITSNTDNEFKEVRKRLKVPTAEETIEALARIKKQSMEKIMYAAAVALVAPKRPKNRN